jgi:hypothetical protein
MVYVFAVLILTALALVAYMVSQAQATTVAHRAEVKTLVDQIVLLKVAPEMAAVQAVPVEVTDGSHHVSAFDDEALAEYEAERARLETETRALVEAVA